MKNAGIKVVYFITDLGVGGAEKLLLGLLNRIDKDRFQPQVCCLYSGALSPKFKELGIKIHDLKIRSKFDFSVFFKFLYLLRKEKPDILHTHLFHANIIGRIAGSLCGVPVIISTQHYSSNFHGYFGILLDRMSSFFCDRIIAVSDAAKRYCIEKEGIPALKLQTIYNGIDPDLEPEDLLRLKLRSLFCEGKEILVGSVGRLVAVKGFKYLLYAAARVIKYHPEIKFFLLGYGPLKSELVALNEKLGISNNVLILEKEVEANEFLAIIDIYVLPSLSEGLSITLLEAMSMAKPVIATKVGGNPEVISDGINGILVPPRDPESLSKAIFSIINDAGFAKRIGSQARISVKEKFNIEKMTRDTEAVYDYFIGKIHRVTKDRFYG